MNRREAFFAALAAPLTGLASISFAQTPADAKPARDFFVNYQAHEFNREAALDLMGGLDSKVFVDGREIRLVWYLNTLTGVVRSYDVHQNGGKPIATRSGWDGCPMVAAELGETLNGHTVEDAGGVLSITLRGRIELYSADGTRLY